MPVGLSSPESPITQIYADSLSFVALHQDGHVTAFGDGTGISATIPASVTSPSSVVTSVVPGYQGYACVHADGSSSSWGRASRPHVTHPIASGVQTVYAGGYGFAAVKDDQTTECWGEDYRWGGGCGGLTNVIHAVGAENSIAYSKYTIVWDVLWLVYTSIGSIGGHCDCIKSFVLNVKSWVHY